MSRREPNPALLNLHFVYFVPFVVEKILSFMTGFKA
jgi:hypothetical protein